LNAAYQLTGLNRGIQVQGKPRKPGEWRFLAPEEIRDLGK